MIVYVETNFVLELTFLQSEREGCNTLLGLAEEAKIALVIPAFSVTEASMARVRLAKQRVEFYERLSRELHELSRSQPYSQISAQTEPLTKALIESIEEQKNTLQKVTSQVLDVAEIIPLQNSTVQTAIGYESTLGLEPADAAVYASIIEDLIDRDGPKVFLNRNSKDFEIPDIEDELQKHDCKMIPSFTNGIAYILRHLPS